MASPSLRDRFFTRPVARAITSPLGIVLFGAGTAAGIVTGIGFAAPLVGLLAWATRVVAAIPRRKRRDRVDAYALSEPWKQYVLQAQSSAAQFRRTVDTALDGPTKDRLRTMAGRLDDGLMDCWRIATRGDQLDAALSTLSTAQATAELAELKARTRQAGPAPAARQTMEALQAQIDSAERLRTTRQDAADRLRLLDARLDEIVARGVEVSVGSADSRGLDDDVTGLVTDLEALRLAIEEVDRASGTGAMPEIEPASGRAAAEPGAAQTSPPREQ